MLPDTVVFWIFRWIGVLALLLGVLNIIPWQAVIPLALLLLMDAWAGLSKVLNRRL